MTAASRHEWRLLAAANPALPVLLAAGRFARPIRRVPRLGWVVADPVTARQILNDAAHFTLLGEGGVGHLWAQVLGDWVYEVFDGAGHHALRSQTRDLFTEENSAALVERVAGPRIARARVQLAGGGVLDVAGLARILVGRIVADLLGMRVPDEDSAYREVFATGEELAALALRTATSTVLAESTVSRAKAIVERMTANTGEAYRTAAPSTALGRCRELGVEPRYAEGLATLLMVAGTETAASAMARTVALLHDTGEYRRLREDPALLPTAVREGLRVSTPAPLIGRAVSADTTVAGRSLKAGERVMILIWTANHAPGGYTLDRPYLPGNRQLWFGAGRHLCLGAPVARAEIGSVLAMLLDTGRDYRVVGRTYRRKVLVPCYDSLRIRHT
jgi:cytochrome P450